MPDAASSKESHVSKSFVSASRLSDLRFVLMGPFA